MEIVRKNSDLNLLFNTETDFQTNLGWEENLMDFEAEVLSQIINPVENYETIRFIHEPYSGCGINQTDLWFYFYFVNSGGTYVQDYTPQGITPKENEHMLKQATQSFFRLEFFKTPGTITNNVLTCEPPTRQNRKLVFAKNLSLPLGEKYFYNTLNGYIHVPVFRGSNYSNKENMYFFWFADESVLTETNLSGTTTLDKYTLQNTGTTIHKFSYLNSAGVKTNVTLSGGTSQTFTGVTNQNFDIKDVVTTYYRNFIHGTNTFFMTAKFYNAKDGTIVDFANNLFSTSHEIAEASDMYYQVDIDKVDYSYRVYQYSGGTKGSRVGTSCTSGNTITPVKFYEKGGGTLYTSITPTPTPTPAASNPASTPAASSAPPNTTPTSTPLTPTYSYKLGKGATSTEACIDYSPDNSDTFWSYCAPSGFTQGCTLYKVGGYPLQTLADDGYYANGEYSWYVVAGTMVGQSMCTFTLTPTPTPTRHGLGFTIYTGQTFSSSTNACNFDYAHTYTGYTNGWLGPDNDVPVNNLFFYKDQYLDPQNVFLGNSNYYIVKRAMPTLAVYAVRIGSTGEITDVAQCP